MQIGTAIYVSTIGIWVRLETIGKEVIKNFTGFHLGNRRAVGP